MMAFNPAKQTMEFQESLPENLKAEIADAIVENFLKGDVAGSLMGLACDETKPYINPDNQDLFSEVSGMVGYKIAGLVRAGAAAWAGNRPSSIPNPEEFVNILELQGWRKVDVFTGKLCVMENSSYPGRQMVFPMDASAPDYAESIQIVMQKLTLLQGPTGVN